VVGGAAFILDYSWMFQVGGSNWFTQPRPAVLNSYTFLGIQQYLDMPGWNSCIYTRLYLDVPGWSSCIYTRLYLNILDWSSCIYTRLYLNIPDWSSCFKTRVYLDVPGWSSCISSWIFCVATSHRRPRPFSGDMEESTLACRVNRLPKSAVRSESPYL
jgi:hypothetical protein